MVFFSSGHRLDVGLPQGWLLWHPWLGHFPSLEGTVRDGQWPGGGSSVPKRKSMRRGCEEHQQGQGNLRELGSGVRRGRGSPMGVKLGVEGEIGS